MATANDVIKGAMRLLDKVAAGETPTAAEAQDGLQALNQMMHAFALDGIDLGHADLALAGAVNLPASHTKALKYLLAVDLASEYDMDPPAVVAVQAQDGMRLLEAHYAEVPTMDQDRGLSRLPSRSWGERR